MTASRSASPTRTAPARWRRPTWKDPRLAGGIALVGAAVALGSWAVDAAAETTQVYVLTQDVAPGADLRAEGVLTLVDSHPGTGAYLEAGSLPQDAVATRSLSAGELLPSAAVGSAQDLTSRTVVLDLSSGLPAATAPGDYVDLWLLPDQQVVATQQQGATLVAQGLIVARIGEAGAGLLGGSGTSVEVRVPEGEVGSVLSAVAREGSLVLVPTGQETP
ncbi:hypothetical protein [Actinomyces capricornis]|uniref:Flagellar protein FlgA n=1 Tax=Actinomyces capricornis TaxID=2755559 RepID=A0ABM7U837_9ACTO|nr:hypothetical protein [Actinomyces capricornis]BDA63642.1 flagellar protein FlgA [Actinomyces capricornis]